MQPTVRDTLSQKRDGYLTPSPNVKRVFINTKKTWISKLGIEYFVAFTGRYKFFDQGDRPPGSCHVYISYCAIRDSKGPTNTRKLEHQIVTLANQEYLQIVNIVVKNGIGSGLRNSCICYAILGSRPGTVIECLLRRGKHCACRIIPRQSDHCQLPGLEVHLVCVMTWSV